MYVLCSATVYTAVLGPGDMLTVPPFWLHHVETLEESVSVNVWSDSPEYATINEMYVNFIIVCTTSILFQIFQASSF